MARRKLIKRVYEKGWEKTIPPPKKYVKAAAVRKPKDFEKFRPSKKPKEVELPHIPKLAAQPDRKEVFIDDYGLPAHYDMTRLVLIPKDPHWIYAYWEIALNSVENLKNKFGKELEGTKFTLRMYDITLVDFNGYNANHYFDIEVGPHANNWYINLWHDNVSYCADIGLKAGSGRFFTLARSNYVHTPRAYYSPRTEQIWMRVTDDIKRPPYVVSRIQKPLIQPHAVPQQYYIPPKKRIYLTEEDIRHYYSKLTPHLRDIISSRLTSFYGRKEHKYSFVLEGESDEERQAVYSRLPKFGFIKKVILGSSESLVLLGASEHLVHKEQAGASEFAQEKMPKRMFFFEIGTELIVYGRTEPDAEVWLGNRKIQLRSDGTFTLRFALPDGKIPLEFKVVSNDKTQKRKITTSVERKTDKETYA